MLELAKILLDYPGYGTPEERRISDEALRAYLLKILGDFLLQVESLKSYLVMFEGSDLARRAGAADERIEQLIDKVQIAPYSFSPFFTVGILQEEILEQIDANDRALVEAGVWIREQLEPTLSVESNFQAILDCVFEMIEELRSLLEIRLNTIMEYQG